MPVRNVIGLMLRPNTMYHVFSGDDACIIVSTIIELSLIDDHFIKAKESTIIRSTRLPNGTVAIQQELLRDLRFQRSRLKKQGATVPVQLSALISILEDKPVRGATGEEIAAARISALCA